MYLNNSDSSHNPIMTRRGNRKLASSAAHKQQQHGQSNTKLYKNRRMKIPLAIATGFFLVHLLHQQGSSIQAQETTGRPMVAATTTPVAPPPTTRQEQQSTAISQQSITITTTTTTTSTEAPTNAQDNNKMTTITIFKIQKEALHNGNNSEQPTWLIDNSDPATTATQTANELVHSSPQPLPTTTTTTTATTPSTVTFASSSSRTPSVLRPSIEEVASKLSRKHLNLEHDNWRLRQASSLSPSLFDDTTKLADGSAGLAPIEAEQDVVRAAAPSADSNLQQMQERGGGGGDVFSSSTTKLSEGHHREQYLHIDAAVVSASGSAAVNQPKSGQVFRAGGRRKKSGHLTGEAYEINQCHQYLKIYNAPSTGNNNPTGLYQMISNQQLPCSCEMRSQVFATELATTGGTSEQVAAAATPTSWLSCDHVQLIGGYLHPQGSNSSGDTWDMGKISPTGSNSAEGGSGPAQVTRFSQTNAGLQTLHAQKFLNLQLSILKSIDLSDNRIRQIKMDAFHGLEESLEHLNLANNLLGDSRAISSSSNAQQQQLKNKLIFFTDEFNRLKKLKWLSLRNNRINQLSATIFTKQQSSASFTTLRLDSTREQLLASDDAATATVKATGELLYLDLSENILKIVPSEAIVSLNTLQTLNLKGNKIVQLDQQSKFPKSLRYLDLSANLIKTIRNCDLIDLPDLIELNLSHNQLSQLDKTAFLSSSSTAAAAAAAAAAATASLLAATVTALHGPNVDASKSSLSLSFSNNLILSAADSRPLTSGNEDEQTKLLAGEQTKASPSSSSLYLERDHLGEDSLSLSLSDASDDQRPRRRTRRNVISDDGVIMDEDDLDAEESGLAASSLAASQQVNTGHDDSLDGGGGSATSGTNSRRQREFNSTIKLNFAYNYFTSLPGDSLLKFANLQQLDLSYNRIRTLDSNYLCSIYNLVEGLRELDLSGNLLTLPQTNGNNSATTPAEGAAIASSSRQLNRLFGCLQKLERLSLGTNRLSSPTSKQRLGSKTHITIEEIVSDEEEDDEFSPRISSAAGDSPDRLLIKFGDNFGSRHLNQLDLSDNQLRTMPLIEQVFQQPSTLMFTNVAKQTKTNSSTPQETAASNDLQQKQLNQWMASRVYLVGLNLSYNYIDRLEEQNFDHLFSLRHLSFDFNRLSALPSKLMRKFTSLDRASFEGNRLSSLEPLNELFERSIRTLRYLNLANNRLTIWPAINKALYENPLRQQDVYAPSLQLDSEDKQASALQFALEELNLEGNLFTSSNVSTLFDQFAYMKSLKILNLGQNLLQRVRSDWFKFANQNLRTLSLAGNKINSIDLGSFANNQLNELQQLSLQHNLLKELKRKTFDSLPKLKWMDLSHNFIHTINSETFHQMQAIKVLNLSYNKLTSWKCEYFSNLCNSISGNINADLSALLSVPHEQQQPQHPATDRQAVSSLIDLDLSHNFVSQLRVNSISVHTKLERLDLSHNKLSYIPHDLFKATILDSKTGRQIQLVSSLKRLNLAHNRIQTVDNINMRPLRNLISLNLSNNELQTLGSDVILIDSSSSSSSSNGNHQRERNIVVSNNVTNPLMDSSNNPADSDAGTLRPHQTARQSRMMQQQPQASGLPALGKLRHLDLSRNQLTQVNQSLLNELSPFVLLNLDLSHNYLESESLPYGFYAKISGPNKQPAESNSNNNYDLVFTLKLESLNLSHNRLNEFPTDLLENHHISMEACNLAHNRIQNLVANSNILIQIKSLNLEFNPLNRESNELILFEHKSLRQLNLAATRLYAIKEVTQSLAQATNQHSGDKTTLKHTRLLANQTSQLDLIRSISKPIDAPYVQHLNLSSNQLVWLAANIFERMHSLQTLDLSNNQLTRLHLLTNQLSPLSASLERLNLASNLFTSIDSTDFSQLTRLRQLDLSSLVSLQKLNCRFLSKLTTLRSLRLFNFPQVRQNVNNILANLQQRRQQQQQQQQDSHAFSSQERMVRKLQQELLQSTIGGHCFRDDEPTSLLLAESKDNLKWYNLQELELELFSGGLEEAPMIVGSGGGGGGVRRGGFQLQEELAQLLGPETKKLTLFGLNLTGLAEDSLLGISGQQLDLKISYTSIARLPLQQVLDGISKRTKLNLDFRNNNIQSLDVRSLQILDELQLNNQILQKGDHSSLRLASNPMRCDCQTRPLWLWLNQRWANFELASPIGQTIGGQTDQLDSGVPGGDFQSAGGNSANYWLKFSSVLQTSDIKCQYPAKLRGKLAQYVNYHDLVCKGSSASEPLAGRQSRKRNETKPSPELSYYSKDTTYNLAGADLEDETEASATADYWDSADATDGTTTTTTTSSSAATSAAQVRVTKFNRFPSLLYNLSVYYLEHIPVPFIVDNQVDDQQPARTEGGPLDTSDLDSTGDVGRPGRMGKRDGNSAAHPMQPIYPILNDRQIVNTNYSRHRPNTQQRHSTFDTLSTLKQFQPAHHHQKQNQLLTDSDVYLLTIMSVAMSIMSFVIIAICLLKYKMDRSDKERILTDHGKMLMSQALFNINNNHSAAGFGHQSFKPKKHSGSSNNSSGKKSSSSGDSNSSGLSLSKLGIKDKDKSDTTAIKRMNTARQTTIPIISKARTGGQVLLPIHISPSSMVMPPAAQNFLMRSPTVQRMQGLATNASDWFKYTLRAYPSNAAMHRGHRRRRLFLGDTVPIASQLTTGKRAIEEQLSAAQAEPGSPATLAVGCPHHAFKAVDKLRRGNTTEQAGGVIEEKCLHCARLLATIQQTKVQYLIGTSSSTNGNTTGKTEQPKQQQTSGTHKEEEDDDEKCFVPPSLIRALAEQLDQTNAESNYVALGPEWVQQRQKSEQLEPSGSHYKRAIRSMRTFGIKDRGDNNEQQQQHWSTTANHCDSKPREGSQIPSLDVIGRFAYQSDSQVDTPTPYDAHRCSSMLGGSSQMDGSEDTNGHYNRDGVFILVPDDSSDGDEDKEPVSVLLRPATTKHVIVREEKSETKRCCDDTDSRFTDQQEESIKMQDECSRSSSPIAYGFMRNSGPSSLASSSAARSNGPQLDHHLNRYQSDHLQYVQPSTFNGGRYSPTSNNNNNSNDITDNYSVVRKKNGGLKAAANSNDDQQQQVIISRL